MYSGKTTIRIVKLFVVFRMCSVHSFIRNITKKDIQEQLFLPSIFEDFGKIKVTRFFTNYRCDNNSCTS